MRADFPQKFNIIQIQKPLRIIHHKGFSLGKIDKTAHLLFKAFAVVVDGFLRHHGAHITSPGRIAHHSGAASD